LFTLQKYALPVTNYDNKEKILISFICVQIINNLSRQSEGRQRGIGALLATSVRNSSTDCDDCRFIGTKEYSLESLGLSAQTSASAVAEILHCRSG
jgi:hypothetical protein